MATNALKTASVLAFERKLDPSDAVFHAGRWDDRANSHAWQPVVVREKSVRGTVHAIVNHPLIPSDIKVYGFIIDSVTGKLTKVNVE